MTPTSNLLTGFQHIPAEELRVEANVWIQVGEFGDAKYRGV